MEEGQVTVDGVSHKIPEPFCVFATQNPTGASGTQLLPDSQMDRFTVRLSIGYPAPSDEREILLSRQKGNPLLQVRQVVTREELLTMQQEAANVYLKPELADYIVSLVGKTRTDPLIARGSEPQSDTVSRRDGKGCGLRPGKRLCPAQGHSERLRLDLRAQAASFR